MNVVKEIQRLNERELQLGLTGRGGSYHDDYKDSAYIFVGNLDFELTEGDVITIFSQFGEIVDVNLVRDKGTGKSKGFAFLAYEDQRSTVLAVDNFNGTTLLGRTLRVDHTKNYKDKKRNSDDEEEEPKPRIAPLGILPGDDKLFAAGSDADSVDLTGLDPEDPMYDFLVDERRKQHKKEKKEEKKRRKLEKKAKKERKKDLKDELKGVKKEAPVSPRREAQGDKDTKDFKPREWSREPAEQSNRDRRAPSRDRDSRPSARDLSRDRGRDRYGGPPSRSRSPRRR